MNKVAFLALTYSNFRKPEIWESFFDEDYKDLFNLYIHNKYPIRGRFAKNSIKDRVPTLWAHPSLVEATFNLLSEAIKDEANQVFILISDSHLPLFDMPNTFESLIKTERLTYNYTNDARPSSQLGYISEFFGLEHKWFYHDQWIIFTRYDVEKFLATKYKHFYANHENPTEHFHSWRCVCMDEYFFGYTSLIEGISFDVKRHCYIDHSRENKKFFLQKGHHKTPYVFPTLNQKSISALKEKFLFVRKVAPETKLPKNIFEIGPEKPFF
jgi:hypothetical protein